MLDLNEIAAMFSNLFGVEVAHVITLLLLFSLVARIAGKLIPDDATGVLGVIRMIATVVGLGFSNRISSGVSESDVVKVVAESKDRVRGEDGKFTDATVKEVAKLKSPAMVGIMALAAALLLGACTPTQRYIGTEITAQLCNNLPLAQRLLDQAKDSRHRARAQSVLNILRSACPLTLVYLDLKAAEKAGILE